MRKFHLEIKFKVTQLISYDGNVYLNVDITTDCLTFLISSDQFEREVGRISII